MRVYHIVKNELEMAVGAFLRPKTYCLENFGVRKRKIEEELENVRKDSFPDFPSRLNCLFVCYDMYDVESRATVGRHIDTLKQNGVIKRVGGDKNGYWEVLLDIRDLG